MPYRYVQISPLLYGWPTVLLGAAIGTVLAVLLSLVRPLEYRSTTRILITQELGDIDAYSASRSAERLADDLTGVLYTSDFMNKVFNAGGFHIDQSLFPTDPLRLRKKWETAVEASVVRASGMLEIRAFHKDPIQAREIANAVAYIYVTQGWTYLSGGNITVQVVDDPYNSRYPVRPNIPVNAVSGFFLGAMAGAAYILIEADRVRRRHQVVHEE